MIDFLLIYSLCIYFMFHVVARSKILKRPRDYIFRSFPNWLTYPLNCAFCFAFHIGWMQSVFVAVVTGILSFTALNLMAVPVCVLLIDLFVRNLLLAVGND